MEADSSSLRLPHDGDRRDIVCAAVHRVGPARGGALARPARSRARRRRPSSRTSRWPTGDLVSDPSRTLERPGQAHRRTARGRETSRCGGRTELPHHARSQWAPQDFTARVWPAPAVLAAGLRPFIIAGSASARWACAPTSRAPLCARAPSERSCATVAKAGRGRFRPDRGRPRVARGPKVAVDRYWRLVPSPGSRRRAGRRGRHCSPGLGTATKNDASPRRTRARWPSALLAMHEDRAMYDPAMVEPDRWAQRTIDRAWFTVPGRPGRSPPVPDRRRGPRSAPRTWSVRPPRPEPRRRRRPHLRPAGGCRPPRSHPARG